MKKHDTVRIIRSRGSQGLVLGLLLGQLIAHSSAYASCDQEPEKSSWKCVMEDVFFGRESDFAAPAKKRLGRAKVEAPSSIVGALDNDLFGKKAAILPKECEALGSAVPNTFETFCEKRRLVQMSTISCSGLKEPELDYCRGMQAVFGGGSCKGMGELTKYCKCGLGTLINSELKADSSDFEKGCYDALQSHDIATSLKGLSCGGEIADGQYPAAETCFNQGGKPETNVIEKLEGEVQAADKKAEKDSRAPSGASASSSEKPFVYEIVDDILPFLNSETCLKREGPYRVPGSTNVVNCMSTNLPKVKSRRFTKEARKAFLEEIAAKPDGCQAMASFFKVLLGEVPFFDQGALSELGESVTRALKENHKDEAVDQAVKVQITKMGREREDLAAKVFAHLRELLNNTGQNKMTPQAVATSIAPRMFPVPKDPMVELGLRIPQNSVVQYMLTFNSFQPTAPPKPSVKFVPRKKKAGAAPKEEALSALGSKKASMEEDVSVPPAEVRAKTTIRSMPPAPFKVMAGYTPFNKEVFTTAGRKPDLTKAYLFQLRGETEPRQCTSVFVVVDRNQLNCQDATNARVLIPLHNVIAYKEM
jgi:hypothetical protein